MTLVEIEAVREEFRRLYAKHQARDRSRKWSSIVAKRSGWCTGTLREFRHGRYHGNNELIAETLKPVLDNLTPDKKRKTP